ARRLMGRCRLQTGAKVSAGIPTFSPTRSSGAPVPEQRRIGAGEYHARPADRRAGGACGAARGRARGTQAHTRKTQKGSLRRRRPHPGGERGRRGRTLITAEDHPIADEKLTAEERTKQLNEEIRGLAARPVR